MHGKNRRSAGRKDKCLLALALLHIVGNPKLMYKYDVYMLLLHVLIVFMSVLGVVRAHVRGVKKSIKRCK